MQFSNQVQNHLYLNNVKFDGPLTISLRHLGIFLVYLQRYCNLMFNVGLNV